MHLIFFPPLKVIFYLMYAISGVSGLFALFGVARFEEEGEGLKRIACGAGVVLAVYLAWFFLYNTVYM